jgi:hypothetical protein
VQSTGCRPQPHRFELVLVSVLAFILLLMFVCKYKKCFQRKMSYQETSESERETYVNDPMDSISEQESEPKSGPCCQLADCSTAQVKKSKKMWSGQTNLWPQMILYKKGRKGVQHPESVFYLLFTIILLPLT